MDGYWTPPGANPPATLAEVRALGALGQTTAWDPFTQKVALREEPATGNYPNWVWWDGAQWQDGDPTDFTAGTPGAFLPAGTDVPADLDAVNALGLSGAAFAAGEYVELGDGSHAYFDGADWQAGEAPAPAPPPDPPCEDD